MQRQRNPRQILWNPSPWKSYGPFWTSSAPGISGYYIMPSVIPCSRCGRNEHFDNQDHRCYARYVNCFKCGKDGHLAKTCWTKKCEISTAVCEKKERMAKSNAKRRRDKTRLQEHRRRLKVQSVFPFSDVSDTEFIDLTTNKDHINDQITSMRLKNSKLSFSLIAAELGNKSLLEELSQTKTELHAMRNEIMSFKDCENSELRKQNEHLKTNIKHLEKGIERRNKRIEDNKREIADLKKEIFHVTYRPCKSCGGELQYSRKIQELNDTVLLHQTESRNYLENFQKLQTDSYLEIENLKGQLQIKAAELEKLQTERRKMLNPGNQRAPYRSARRGGHVTRHNQFR